MFKKGNKAAKKEPWQKKPPTPRKSKVVATPAEKAHMGEVAALGCICCSEAGIFREAQVHHLRHGTQTLNVGMSVRSDHFKTIPLCKMHHGPDGGGPGVSFHDGPRDWRWDEVELLKRVWKRLIHDRIIPTETPVGEPYEPTRLVISYFNPSSRFSSPGGYGLGS